MPADCYFNVVGFGFTHEFLFRESVKYSDKSMREAIIQTKSWKADLGGTEILEPLQAIYTAPCIEGYQRQIFVLTDGQVCNTETVIGLVGANAHKSRVFSLGIGNGVSHHLVEGIARAGSGTSAFVSYGEKLQTKVLNQLKNSMQPSLLDIHLEWDVVGDKNKWKQSPKHIPPVFNGSQLLVFGLFEKEIPKSVTIKAKSPDGPLSLKIEHFRESDLETEFSEGMLHHLAAIKLIRELELEDNRRGFYDESLKTEISKLGCRHGLASRYTSFVAVDENNQPDNMNWALMNTIYVPSQLPIKRPRFEKLINYCLADYTLAAGESEGPPCGLGMVFFCLLICCCGPCYLLCQLLGWAGNRCLRAITTRLPTALQREHQQGRSAGVGKEYSEINFHELNEVLPNPLERMVSLQSFDGSYCLEEAFCGILGKNIKDLKNAASANNLEETVMATALAIAFFTTKLSSDKDVWDLVVMKARKWLENTVNSPAKAEGVVLIAKSIL